MRDGNWIAIRKGYEFPKHREFSEIEAAYSLQLDYDNGNEFTISGMAANWRWSETKVRNFLLTLGVQIQYPETQSRKKRGILIPSERRIKEECSENKPRIKEEYKLFCFNDLEDTEKNKKRIKGDKKKNKAPATIDTNTKPNKDIFVLPEWIPEREWNAYVEMRNETKKPLTDYAKKLKVNKLERLRDTGNDPGKVLNRSVEKCWEDVYELPADMKPAQKKEPVLAY